MPAVLRCHNVTVVDGCFTLIHEGFLYDDDSIVEHQHPSLLPAALAAAAPLIQQSSEVHFKELTLSAAAVQALDRSGAGLRLLDLHLCTLGEDALEGFTTEAFPR